MKSTWDGQSAIALKGNLFWSKHKINSMKLHCDVVKKVTPFIAAPRRPPNWIIHCCYQMTSRERKLVQRLVNGLFWLRQYQNRGLRKPHIGSFIAYGFIAQLVEHRTGIAEVTSSNPLMPWFIQILLSNLNTSFQLLKLENLLRWSYIPHIKLV